MKLSVYLSSLLSLLIATMLGFLDDIFDIRWRHKIPIPIIASIPLLIVYYADNGNTHIVVPIPFRPLFGSLLNLGTSSLYYSDYPMNILGYVGPLYYLYMSLLSTFSTNSINILAGINGSEVSQAVIIALSVVLNDLLYLPWPTGFRVPLYLLGSRAEVEVGGVWSAGMAYGSTELVERHLFSLYFMLPLLGVCLGFLYHNWCACRLWCCTAPNLNASDEQVSVPRIPRRYAVLFDRHGVRRCGHSGALFQDAAPILPSPNLQLCPFLSPAFWACTMPAPSRSPVRIHSNSATPSIYTK